MSDLVITIITNSHLNFAFVERRGIFCSLIRYVAVVTGCTLTLLSLLACSIKMFGCFNRLFSKCLS